MYNNLGEIYLPNKKTKFGLANFNFTYMILSGIVAGIIILFIVLINYLSGGGAITVGFIIGCGNIVTGFLVCILLIKKPLRTVNPFGIYKEGISPPTKPGFRKYRKGFFIPYKDIKNIKITNIWDGNKVPKRPFYFIIKTRDDDEFQISAGDLVVQYFGDNVSELKMVYELLCKVKEELEKDENRKRFERNEEIILKKGIFDGVLKREYDIPTPRRKTIFKH